MNKEDGYFWKKNNYLRYPRYLQVEITNRCILNCPQCYKEKFTPQDMDMTIFSSSLREAQELGITTIYLNGGEPFLHNQIREILNLLSTYSFKVYCFSSGIGITKEILHEIVKIKEFYLSISLNATTKNLNQLSRDGYEISIAAMKWLQKNYYSYGVNWVCRHDNVYNFADLVDFAKSLDAKWINVAANKMAANGDITSPLEYEDYIYLKEVIDKNSGYVRVQYCYNILNDILDRPINQKLNGCNAGIVACCINVNGKYMPCTHLYYPEEFEGIRDYWQKSTVIKKLREARVAKKKCTFCEKNRACHFCKALSVETSKNFMLDLECCPLKIYYN